MLFAGVYVCTFQPGKFTGWGSEGVNLAHSPITVFEASVETVCSVIQGVNCVLGRVCNTHRTSLTPFTCWVNVCYP